MITFTNKLIIRNDITKQDILNATPGTTIVLPDREAYIKPNTIGLSSISLNSIPDIWIKAATGGIFYPDFIDTDKALMITRSKIIV